MKTTLKDHFIAALMAKGESVVDTRSSKYVKLTRNAGGYYFVGKSGSLRFGSAFDVSVPCSDKYKKYLLTGSSY